MSLPFKSTHPEGEQVLAVKNPLSEAIEVDTYAGKVEIEWDQNASVTPIGQLPFFIQFLKLGGRFDPWVNDCPLDYHSNNAPDKIDVLGSLFLSVLSGHNRYAHITSLLTDKVNSKLLGMNKVVSDDSARRGLKKIDEKPGVDWLQTHLHKCYAPLLKTPWILDADVTVKPLYGKQEGAKLGYNPQKPGRPSHTYHTYMMANLRLVLEVEVQPGDQSHSNYSLPGLVNLLKKLPINSRPQFVRGDIGWGTDPVMSELESMGQAYLFKLKKTPKIKELIVKHHGIGNWGYINPSWEIKEDTIQLQGWDKPRRVAIVRQRVVNNRRDSILAVEYEHDGQGKLAFVDNLDDFNCYEYSVLVTDLDDDLLTLYYHYRDRADCENNFDELKNQWGWGGYTTQDIKSCQLMSRIIALIYNWWNLFVRLAIPEKHHEAITSRPLLLSSIGRLTEHRRQKKMTITNTHGDTSLIKKAYGRLTKFFKELKLIAPQLTIEQLWDLILAKAMEIFQVKIDTEKPMELPT